MELKVEMKYSDLLDTVDELILNGIESITVSVLVYANFRVNPQWN